MTKRWVKLAGITILCASLGRCGVSMHTHGFERNPYFLNLVLLGGFGLFVFLAGLLMRPDDP